MATLLPPSTDITSSGTTQGGAKVYHAAVHTFLAALLGTDAEDKPAARAALGAQAASSYLSSIANGDHIDLTGTVLADDAPAGKVGEYFSATVPYASRINLTSGAAANIGYITLPAGDWFVQGVGSFDVVTGPAQFISASISTTSATLGNDTQTAAISGAMVAGYSAGIPTPIVRVTTVTPVTVYLVVRGAFSGGYLQSWGSMKAWRRR